MEYEGNEEVPPGRKPKSSAAYGLTVERNQKVPMRR